MEREVKVGDIVRCSYTDFWDGEVIGFFVAVVLNVCTKEVSTDVITKYDKKGLIKSVKTNVNTSYCCLVLNLEQELSDGNDGLFKEKICYQDIITDPSEISKWRDKCNLLPPTLVQGGGVSNSNNQLTWVNHSITQSNLQTQ